MFSYRHGFHAGNHADVLKHLVLVQLLRRMTVKDKALLFVDTHAGGGTYALDEGFAARSAEGMTGIARLRGRPPRAPALVEYLAEVA
ncbi:MAG: 23S rRNA (adenine(2030)-N(6))-methyltransferase RlmJ, partial [Burkholderiales bacterium]